MNTLTESSFILNSIKACLLAIREGHSTWSREIGGWPGTSSRVDDALKAIDKLELSGISLRDHIALTATEEDIQSFKDLVPLITTEVSYPYGHKEVVEGIPVAWRATARYLYADAMLAAREPKGTPEKLTS